MVEINTPFEIICEHGESPVWDYDAKIFYWVDLQKGNYFKADLKTGSLNTFSVGQPLGVLAVREIGGLILAVRDGFAFYDEIKNKLEIINNPEAHLLENRFNDGAIDPIGRFLAGTMQNDGKNSSGNLYSLNSELEISELENSLFITNGMDWSEDGKTFYLTDTNQHTIFAYDYNIETGLITNQREFIKFSEEENPDGMCMDAEGNFWVAMFNGFRISKFDIKGKKIKDIILPVQCPTSCCFGESDLSTLFITTCTFSLSEKQKQEQPLSGKILTIETDSKGKPMNRFKG